MIKNTQSAKLVDFNRKPQNTTCRWLFLFEQINHTFKQRVGSTCLKLVFSPPSVGGAEKEMASRSIVDL